jgi:hypothetical protein
MTTGARLIHLAGEPRNVVRFEFPNFTLIGFDRPGRIDPEPPVSRVEKVRRAVAAAGRGAEAGTVSGLAARALLRRRGRITSDGTATVGAAVGALANGALQIHRDTRKRDFASRVATTYLEARGLRGIQEAVADNVEIPIPGADGARTAVRIAKKPLVKRIASRLLKIGAGAGAGYYIGKKLGAKAGAATGAIAGLLFQDARIRAEIRNATTYAKSITNL